MGRIDPSGSRKTHRTEGYERLKIKSTQNDFEPGQERISHLPDRGGANDSSI